jgi:hypothetical protein
LSRRSPDCAIKLDHFTVQRWIADDVSDQFCILLRVTEARWERHLRTKRGLGACSGSSVIRGVLNSHDATLQTRMLYRLDYASSEGSSPLLPPWRRNRSVRPSVQQGPRIAAVWRKLRRSRR